MRETSRDGHARDRGGERRVGALKPAGVRSSNEGSGERPYFKKRKLGERGIGYLDLEGSIVDMC
jgi:hypothetical protein